MAFISDMILSMKKWILVFVYAFGLNLVWENAHHFLYVHYKGGVITEFILARAAVVDALIILGLILLFHITSIPKRYSWLLIIAGVSVSIGIEYWALGINRWEYNDMMPIIPALQTGLTPTIQLGLLGYIVYRILFREKSN